MGCSCTRGRLVGGSAMDKKTYEKALKGGINVMRPNVQKGEEVAIVGSTDVDPDLYRILSEAAYACDAAEVTIGLMAPRKGPGMPPPRPVQEMMKTADVVFCAASTSLGFSPCYTECLMAGHKAHSFPVPPGMKKAASVLVPLGIYNTEKLQELKGLTLRTKEMLTQAKNVRVTTPKGTDLRVSIEGRAGVAYYGIADQDAVNNGSWPPSEAHIAAVEETAEGVVVADGFVSGIGRVTQPLKLVFKQGRLVRMEGGPEAEIIRRIKDNNTNVDKFAEVGVGTNKYLKVSGNNGDKKIWGTAHIAIGNSASSAFGGANFDGTIVCDIHIDFHIQSPVLVEIDGRALVKDGKLLV
jgi:leucyl aminopeptidase (aminopeptidase T)